MSSHSRKPKWAEGAERISWAHCRRPNCGAKPYIPSTVDPRLCQDCAAEYLERGRKFCALCPNGGRWLPASAFPNNRTRCRACIAAQARARYAAAPEKHRERAVRRYEQHRETINARRRSPEARARQRAYDRAYLAAPERRQRRARVVQAWRDAHPERVREQRATSTFRRKLRWLRGVR